MTRRLAKPWTAYVLVAVTVLLFAATIPLARNAKVTSTGGGGWRWAMGTVGLVGCVWMIGAYAIAAETIALGHVVIEPSGDLKQIEHQTSGWAWWTILQDVWFVLLLCAGVIWLASRVPAYR